ncbi:aromatic amino acid hydroxylase [Leeuwenhoekiella marinoflava]|uniref:Phenylalanine-4-hydroxylase n=2 Tax=Leeuwenhoekiella marinoflava TaxID=988 RepID=A0A4Q0PKT5_9FLAO|nr:aromatic amino acid hydroxylase [Leeuwenhoekiella marinoflava]RXG27362.1 phenylalanine-4-hydroxylase [Leeuwenhoekiella marinoflava]SHF71395.1 phenylalanine-4-hydroxylase [Leeuwenhoekiella marinoflava DSM 3653]
MSPVLDKNIETNPLIERLPVHLKQFIKPQNYEEYTAVNQAVWRYVMRKNVNYLSTVAHKSYLDGLKQTGISIDHIPNMYGMNRILKEIGWAAVAVDGFIPPAAFMEFQAYNVLVIASDIRQLEHLEYTPAPDIIHEGAGHAPIIANPEYAEYLRRFGEIGCKAISSAKDYELYEAVRKLSILKEAEDTPQQEIEEIEELVAYLQNNMGTPSEMALIRNLHWWTVEYGLIGTPEKPKIYGAGLLSSIGESAWCMTEKVKKIPYSIEAAHQEFDITKPQPQLYVTPDFAYLSEVLEEFANTMALRTGGPEGLQKLIDSKNLGTIELSTGLQVSGVFSEMILHKDKVSYVQTTGKSALSHHEKELVGHGTNIHKDGYGTALGKLKGINLAIEDMSPKDLQAYKISEGNLVTLEFEGGISVSGKIITGTRNLKGKIILISFENCTVKHNDRLLFRPEFGIYHLAVGKKISSAFAGPADFKSFNLLQHQISSTTAKASTNAKRQELESLYLAVRNYREGKDTLFSPQAVFDILKKKHENDWLLSVELYELAKEDNREGFLNEIKEHLEDLKLKNTKIKHLIEDGIALV